MTFFLSLETGAIQKCTDYGGIGERTCCTASCGTCGGRGCGKRPGGAENCCGRKIYEICGAEGQRAPCIIIGNAL